jgi:hypothetical protein
MFFYTALPAPCACSPSLTLSAPAQVVEATRVGDYEAAVPALNSAFQSIDKNVKRNIVHKNTAARKKSQLHLKVKKLEGAGSSEVRVVCLCHRLHSPSSLAWPCLAMHPRCPPDVPTRFVWRVPCRSEVMAARNGAVQCVRLKHSMWCRRRKGGVGWCGAVQCVRLKHSMWCRRRKGGVTCVHATYPPAASTVVLLCVSRMHSSLSHTHRAHTRLFRRVLVLRCRFVHHIATVRRAREPQLLSLRAPLT